MAHQKEGVEFLKRVDGVGALLWDPGVGKTLGTLAYVDHLADTYGEVRVLVVAPLTAADTWVLQPPTIMRSPTKSRMLQGPTKKLLVKIAEARDWATVPDMPIKVDHQGDKKEQVSGNRVTILSMSAGAISSFCGNRPNTAQMLSAIRKYDPHLIVIDESHIIKAATSTISKAMYQIGQLANRRIILTGTVNPHGPLDVYGQWRFLAPWTFSDSYSEKFTKDPVTMKAAQKRAIKPWPWTRFKTRYSLSGGYQNYQTVGYVNLDELNDRVAERSMVVRKEDALDLPPVTDSVIHVSLTPKERKAYDEMRKDLAAQLEDGSLLEAPNALAKIMKLRQITAGFARDTEQDRIIRLGTSKQTAVKELVNTSLLGENRLVVFAYFRSECAALADVLKAQGRTVELITGETKPKDRLAIRQRFKDVAGNPEQIVLVAQARTMSLSVNELVTAQNGIFVSLSERRDDWVQARGRLDRNGQVGNHVTFWNFVVPDTIDEIMLQRHKDRGDMEKSLLDHIKAVRK